MRYPAIPLIAHDPYFSVWSFDDNLNDSWQKHWTGSSIGMCGLLRVDGEAMTFSGGGDLAPKMKQNSVRVLPTRTIYEFECKQVTLTLTFLTPALPHKLAVMARPITYIVFELESRDGKEHDCRICWDCGGEPCVDQVTEKITWSRYKHKELELMSLSANNQRMLERAGDNLRIDWGHFYLGVPKKFDAQTAFCHNQPLRRDFVATGNLPEEDYLCMPEPVRQWTAMAIALHLVARPEKKACGWIIAGYDDGYSVEYLGRKLPGFWHLEFASFDRLLTAAAVEFDSLRRECEAYDAKLMADAEKAGGKKYAELCAISFRQAIAAHKLVCDLDGTALFFSKENFSNGCIATVDVTYPSAPLFLLTQPALVKGMLTPILTYAESYRWKFPFAPHDLGTYPLANGQIYGGGEKTEENQMPVEECGNMLLLAGALSEFCGDIDYIRAHQKTLRLWAEYLLDKGYDPENQLCTDDFAGHLAHNTNLSLKAILALGAWSQMAAKLGEVEESVRYLAAAREAAQRWVVDAWDGDHYRLAFDQPGTWSQKYNLVWDRLLNLNLFPAKVAEEELAYYRTKQQKYGLPLDSRRTYTKLDWIVWSATLTGKESDFLALTDPLYDWINAAPSRVPLTDWYETTTGKQVGFQARSVVGGVFIKMLADPELRKNYLAML